MPILPEDATLAEQLEPLAEVFELYLDTFGEVVRWFEISKQPVVSEDYRQAVYQVGDGIDQRFSQAQYEAGTELQVAFFLPDELQWVLGVPRSGGRSRGYVRAGTAIETGDVLLVGDSERPERLRVSSVTAKAELFVELWLEAV